MTSPGSKASDVTVKKMHKHYFSVGGVSILVKSFFPFDHSTYSPKMELFQVQKVESPEVVVFHQFNFPDICYHDLGPQINNNVYFRAYRKNRDVIYISTRTDDPISLPEDLHLVNSISIFNETHTMGNVFHADRYYFELGGLESLFCTGSDQLPMSTVLAEHSAFFLHSCGLKMDNNGVVFAGHSGAGKSTIAKMFKNNCELLCDDRIIIRRWPDTFKMHGTWNHGELPQVSAAEVPLRAIFFPVKDGINKITKLERKKEILLKLLENVITPITTKMWWEKIFVVFDKLIEEVPCYDLHFDKSGNVVELVEDLCRTK